MSTESFRIPSHSTLREDAFNVLERRIIMGQLKPGQRLVETELATELGISRSPLREALNALRHAGWVEARPRLGSFVRVPTRKDIEQFFHVRVILEMEAARLAASRVDSEVCMNLTKLAEGGRDAVGDSRLGNNIEFHSAVAAASGNELLAEMCASLNKRLRWYTGPLPERKGQAAEEHVQLSSLIAKGDVDNAALLMRKHILLSADAVLENYPFSDDENRSETRDD